MSLCSPAAVKTVDEKRKKTQAQTFIIRIYEGKKIYRSTKEMTRHPKALSTHYALQSIRRLSSQSTWTLQAQDRPATPPHDKEIKVSRGRIKVNCSQINVSSSSPTAIDQARKLRRHVVPRAPYPPSAGQKPWLQLHRLHEPPPAARALAMRGRAVPLGEPRDGWSTGRDPIQPRCRASRTLAAQARNSSHPSTP